ncbi:hypothetical protein AVEN_241200-1 [Araneus ventricosus]|uniref:Uncharacterized protein n=1 Tax=Araneus ventricosus TaxID=182803 RepID=A0A4Y2CZI8_ARAVE|nr:hypothetical protein AVEN_241200-1 [Araneus ventricosus]
MRTGRARRTDYAHHSNNQINTHFPHSRNITNASNSSPRGATSSTSVVSSFSSNRTSTTKPVATRTNESHTINCIKTNTNKHALIPAIINKIPKFKPSVIHAQISQLFNSLTFQLILSFSRGLMESSRLLITK